MQKIRFSREPAVWIGLIGAVAAAVVQSGAVPQLSDNAAAYTTLIALLVGVAIRFFVNPKSSPSAPAPAPAPPSAPPSA